MEPEIPVIYGKGTGFDEFRVTLSYNLTKGGRTTKPTQKLQDM